MFHRRNKVSAHAVSTRPSGPPPASAAASSAATLAFQKSNPSLSHAAAVVALRSNPHPPTDVARVHTKRLERRESAGSSQASGSPRPGLERRTSLTERQLRSPSPGREASSANRNAINTPPVPPLPPGMERTASGRIRAASAEPKPSLRIASPPPSNPGGRGVSLDRAPATPHPAKRQPANPKLSNVSEYTEMPQRSSVNFSRPMSPLPKSPTSPVPASPTSPSTRQTGWFAGPVVSGGQPRQSLDSLTPKSPVAMPASEVSGIQTSLQGIADKPVKKKKKRLSSGGNQGSHIKLGSMDITGTAVGQSPREVAAASPTPEPDTPMTTTTTTPYAASESGRSSMDSGSDVSFAGGERTDGFKTRAGALLARQPSLIDEAPEYESQHERANTGKKVEALATKSVAPSEVPKDVAVSDMEPTAAPAVQPITTSEISVSVVQPQATNGTTVHRNTSLSPSRSAHFSPKPEFLDGLIHNPPGRSVSPVKSALKHSPSSSVRTASPDVRISSAPASEVGSDRAASRKKSTRVSFDDTPVILSKGVEASRYASQSPTRTRDALDDNEQFDDIMRPRPALPSFGSVRSRKNEDPKTESPTRPVRPLGHSSDHGVGGILVQDFAGRQAAEQPQHDPSMPLAPEVTTVEGTGYDSDSQSETDDAAPPAITPTPAARMTSSHVLEEKRPEPETIKEAVEAIQDSHVSPALNDATGQASAAGNQIEALTKTTALSPPMIAVEPATPTADAEEPKKEFLMPGSFPGAWDDEVSQPAPAKSAVAVAQPASGVTTAALLSRDESDTESDTSSIWSDAEEDLAAGPGGFASLNAIVDAPSPVVESAPSGPGLSLSKHAPAQDKAEEAEKAPPSPVAAQWDAATAYWRSLNEQQRKELEKQALRKLSAEMGKPMPEEDSSEDEEEGEDLEKTLVEELPRPTTPPMQKNSVIKAPQLESPIALKEEEQVVVPKQRRSTKLRSSMRQSQPLSSDEEAPWTMKKSMRNSMRETPVPAKSTSGSGHHFRKSMRGPPPEPRPDSTRRHSSGLDVSKWSQEGQRKPFDATGGDRPRTAGGVSGASPAKSALKTVTAVPPVPTLQRQDSDDSVSSFRRQRASAPTPKDGAVTMRRSMRNSFTPAPVEPRPQSPVEKQKKPGRFSLRSLSPVARVPAESPKMRSSMRTGTATETSPATLRAPESKKSRFKSPTRLGFGKSKPLKSSPKTQRMAPEPAAAPLVPSVFTSRLRADSDDESDEAHPTFVSRFADSDDELDSSRLPKNLTPVRGIPRGSADGDADSTDLDDSDNERTKKVPAVPSLRDVDIAHGKTSTTMINGDKANSILAAGSLRKADPGLGASKHAPVTPERSPQQKRRLSWLGMGSSKKRSSSLQATSSFTSPPPSRGNDATAPTKPNLLRRSTPTGLPFITEDANWPLPDAGEEAARPKTSDGTGTALRLGTMRRPDAGKRRSTADYVGSERNAIEESVDGDPEARQTAPSMKRVSFSFEDNEPVYSARTGRKKRFGALRRVFGLND